VMNMPIAQLLSLTHAYRLASGVMIRRAGTVSVDGWRPAARGRITHHLPPPAYMPFIPNAPPC
jgi:hypothetical protein